MSNGSNGGPGLLGTAQFDQFFERLIERMANLESLIQQQVARDLNVSAPVTPASSAITLGANPAAMDLSRENPAGGAGDAETAKRSATGNTGIGPETKIPKLTLKNTNAAATTAGTRSRFGLIASETPSNTLALQAPSTPADLDPPKTPSNTVVLHENAEPSPNASQTASPTASTTTVAQPTASSTETTPPTSHSFNVSMHGHSISYQSDRPIEIAILDNQITIYYRDNQVDVGEFQRENNVDTLRIQMEHINVSIIPRDGAQSTDFGVVKNAQGRLVLTLP